MCLSGKRAVRDAHGAIGTIFALKTNKMNVLCYYLQCILKIFITSSPFVYVKTNSKKSVKK